MGVIYYYKINFIIPDKPKATRLPLRWNYKRIKGTKTIYKRSSFDGRVSSFWNEAYLYISQAD